MAENSTTSRVSVSAKLLQTFTVDNKSMSIQGTAGTVYDLDHAAGIVVGTTVTTGLLAGQVVSSDGTVVTALTLGTLATQSSVYTGLQTHTVSGTEATVTISGIGLPVELLMDLKDVQHDSGSNQAIQVYMSYDNGGHWGAAVAITPSWAGSTPITVPAKIVCLPSGIDQYSAGYNQASIQFLSGSGAITAGANGTNMAVKFGLTSGSFKAGTFNIRTLV